MRYELSFESETPLSYAATAESEGFDLEGSELEGSDLESSDLEGFDLAGSASEGFELEAPSTAYARAGGVEPGCPEYRQWVQRSLNRLLGLSLKEDGAVGDETRKAIRRFRKEKGLGDNAKIDLKLEAALVGAGVPPPPVSYPPPRPGAAGGAAWVRGLLPLLEKYRRDPARGDIPLDFLVGWVAVESGGCVGVVTKEPLDERGYFQIHRQERANKKIRVDGREIERERLSNDPEYAVRAGVELVRHYAGEVERVYKLKRTSPLFWRMVKFMHTGSGYVQVVWRDMVAHGGGPPTSWDAIRAHVDNFWNNFRLRQHKFFKSRDPRTLVANVDKLFEKARQLLPQSSGGASQELYAGGFDARESDFELALEAEPFGQSAEFNEFDETESFDNENYYELSDELTDESSDELSDELRRWPARGRVRAPRFKPRQRPRKPPRRPRPRPRPVAFRVPAGSLNIFSAPRPADAAAPDADGPDAAGADAAGADADAPQAPASQPCACAAAGAAGKGNAAAGDGGADAAAAEDQSELYELEWLDPEASEQFGESFEWMEEISRSSPDYVRWLQQSLNRVLGLRLAADGVAGAQTRSAVRSFQQRKGLQATGTVDADTEKALVASGASRPPASGITPASQSATGLIKRESSPPSETIYVRLPLGSESPARPMTGIFFPQGYKPQPQVDLIIYLHGFKTSPTLTIDGYWDGRRFPHFALREGLNDARKNVVLVAPTLGARSQPGWLTQPGGFDKYVDQVLAALAADGPHKEARQTPRVGNIVLACHSGGGLRMRQLALSGSRYAARIKECWGFDCTYNRGDDTQWAQWARSRPDAQLFIYYIANSPTQPLALSLKRQQVSNVFVTASKGRGHNWVPIAHWRERIQAAGFLHTI